MNYIIPTPRLAELDERVFVPAHIHAPLFKDAADTLQAFARRIHGILLTESDGTDGITFSLDANLPAESYRLEMVKGTVRVAAADEPGAQNAVSSLIQIMEKSGAGFTLPSGRIEDAPECSWRGVMIDLARDWHELPRLYEYADMCRFYKIKYLQLHFTDDQSYTLPSRAFPKLSTEGRHYTEQEIKDFAAYANKIGVEIIPEIDSPGHSRPFNQNYGEIFGTDGIIRQDEKSLEAIDTLYRELCEMFPTSQYIHMGGDEAAIEKWTECPATMEYYRQKGVDVDHMGKRDLAEVMYASFIQHVCKTILSCGKTPVVWEGFAACVNEYIPRETVVMSWENYYQTADALLKAGFRVVNCSWRPTYIVTPIRYWSPEELYNWSVYHWKAVHPASPLPESGLTIEPTMQVEGGQMQAWGDAIVAEYPDVRVGVREEQRLVEERIPCLAENTWNREKRMSFREFKHVNARINKLYRFLYENQDR